VVAVAALPDCEDQVVLVAALEEEGRRGRGGRGNHN